MATIYAMVRLLPPSHPYLNPKNTGKYGIRHVITEAANNLTFNKSNIDQIVVFFALLMGFILLVMQFMMILVMVVIKPVLAGMFDTPFPTNDIAFLLLDHVLGVPGFFCNNGGTCSSIQGTLPTPMHAALHSLFQFYSLAILVIAVLVFIYYVFVMVGETAQTGTPFGRRFSHIWAPLRLVVALGLLVPVNYGLNSAQYITLAAARMGSGLATNGWILFNNTLNAPWSLNDESSLIAEPSSPDLTPFVNFMLLVSACKQSYEYNYSDRTPPIIIQPYLVSMPYNNGAINTTLTPPGPGGPGAYPYDTALTTFYNNDDVIIRFGHLDPNYTQAKGNVRNFCGEVKIHTNDAFHYRVGGNLAGALEIQEKYFNLARDLLANPEIIKYGKRAACISLPNMQTPPHPDCNFSFSVGDTGLTSLPSAAFIVALMDGPGGINTQFKLDITAARASMMAAMISTGDIDVPQSLIERGWGGAGMWYNRIAEWNGSFVAAVMNVPTPQSMPEIMEMIREERLTHDENVDALYIFEPAISGKNKIEFGSTNPQGQYIVAAALNTAYLHLKETDGSLANDIRTNGNIFFDMIGSVLGLEGLFNMRNNKTSHPLAQLTSIGKSMIESSIRNLMGALLFSAGGGAAQAINPHLGPAVSAIGSIFSSMATIGLTVGFILYYILPFMPFIYFFFAVGGWVKGIFEAMVGVPLWALAHLRIDGEGLPSQTASNGYYLILEIFIRPILTVFGLIASAAIFSALARVLNEIFPLLTQNLAGYATSNNAASIALIENAEFKRGVIDEFFFTIIYAILIYLIGTSSFKLIDMIPNNILRWIGAGVQSFGDQSGDPTQGLVQYAAIGGGNIAGQAVGAAQGLTQAGGQAVGFGLSGALGKFSTRTGNAMSGTNSATTLASKIPPP